MAREPLLTEPAGGAKSFWESDAWIRGVIESAEDGIVTIGEGNTIHYMNPAALNMFGYSAEEALGQNVSMLMPPSDAASHDAHVARYVETGERHIIGIGREVSGLHKSGALLPIHLTISEAHIGGQRLFTAIIRDISREKGALDEQQRLLAELKDRNKKITCLYSVGEVIRATEFGSDLFEGVSRLIRPACHDPETARARIMFDDRVHVEMPFEESPHRFKAEIKVAGRVRGLIEVYYLESPRDEESAHYLEEDQNLLKAVARTLGNTVARREAWAQVHQASKLASVGELAAGVGHEINNPTNGIINCADLLIQNLQSNERNLKYAKLVRSEAERIATIVKNLLTFSRQEREQHSLARLYDIVQGVLSLSGKKIARSNIQLEVDVPESLPKLKCRSEQIQQVLMNLIINAIHALDERYPEAHPDKRMSIKASQLDLNGEPFLRLSLRDTGTGIAPRNLERLFDPFFTTKGRDKGTGLGLSVSDGIVKDHGGRILCESTLGEYTVFHVDLPLDNRWSLGHEPNIGPED